MIELEHGKPVRVGSNDDEQAAGGDNGANTSPIRSPYAPTPGETPLTTHRVAGAKGLNSMVDVKKETR